MEKTVICEIPDDLKRLVKLVIRGFYGDKEEAIVVDYLLRNSIMSEDEMESLLKLDKKLLRIILNRLKSDHLVNHRMKIELQADGKNVKQMYYYINYKAFVNVVKYKLYQMRKKVESQERNEICKAQYKCSSEKCSRMYSELDIDKLLDFSAASPEPKMLCTFCGSEVEEGKSEKQDGRALFIKFNQQTGLLYDLLRNIESYTLSYELLEPTEKSHTDSKVENRFRNTPSSHHSSTQSNVSLKDLTQNVSIDLGVAGPKEAPVAKEAPLWMTQSTIGASEPVENTPTTEVADAKNQPQSQKELEKIKRTLLQHEKKTLSKIEAPGAVSRDASDSDTSESNSSESPPMSPNTVSAPQPVDEMSDEEDEDPMISVNGKLIPYSDVTPDDVALMTSDEKATYQKVGQELFSALM